MSKKESTVSKKQDVKVGDKGEDLAKKELKPSPFGDILLLLDYNHAKSDFSVLVVQCQNLVDADTVTKLRANGELSSLKESTPSETERNGGKQRSSESASKSSSKNSKKQDEVDVLPIGASKVNAFVKLTLLPDMNTAKQTKVVHRSNNPQYSQRFHFKVSKGELETRRLLVTVWDRHFTKKDFIGEVIIPLQYETFQEKVPKFYPLRTIETFTAPVQPPAVAYRGELTVRICFATELTASGDPKISTDDDDIDPKQKGVLFVVLKGAANLLHPKRKVCSTFCKCVLYDTAKDKCGGEEFATETIRKKNNPNWNRRFEIPGESLSSLQRRCLEISVWHSGKKKKAQLGGFRLNLATTVISNNSKIVSPHSLPAWMDARGDESLLWFAVTERPNNWIEATLQLRSLVDDDIFKVMEVTRAS